MDIEIQNFSNSSVDNEKGKAVLNQISLYDQILGLRIKIQKLLLASNQLPSPDEWNRLIEDISPKLDQSLKKGISFLLVSYTVRNNLLKEYLL